MRAMPSGDLGPVLNPPWRRRRPRVAGLWAAVPRLVRAPHRGADDGTPTGFPFRSRLVALPGKRSFTVYRVIPFPAPGASKDFQDFQGAGRVLLFVSD